MNPKLDAPCCSESVLNQFGQVVNKEYVGAMWDVDPITGIVQGLVRPDESVGGIGNVAHAAEHAEIGVLSSRDTAVLSGARLIDAAPTAVIVGGAATYSPRAAPFNGWGCKYTVPDGSFKFSHLRIPTLQQTAASVLERWETIVFNVRSGSVAGNVIATGTYKIPAYSATLNNVIVKLSAVVDSALIGGNTYWVDYCGYNKFGQRCPCGRYESSSPASVMPNFVPLSAMYRLTTTGLWLAVVGGLAGYGAPLIVEPYFADDALVPAASGLTPEIVLPTIYGVVGRELNCYFSGLVEGKAALLDWDVTCAIGKQQQERFTAIPAAISTGTAISVTALNPVNQAVLASASSTIVVADAAKAGTAELLIIGDSTTAGGNVTAELLVLDTADAALSMTLLGTQGTAPNRHEGRSGWSSAQFVTEGSPLYNAGILDIPNYITTNTMTGLTHVVINLGINDIFSALTDAAADVIIESLVTNVGKIVQGFQGYSGTIKIGVALTTPPSDSQDSFGEKYGAGQTLTRYRRNWFRLIKRLKAAFDAIGAANVYVLPFSVSLDTKNNMNTVSVAVNSRNATVVTRQSNGVHPAGSGYLQLADVVYAWIKCTLP